MAEDMHYDLNDNTHIPNKNIEDEFNHLNEFEHNTEVGVVPLYEFATTDKALSWRPNIGTNQTVPTQRVMNGFIPESASTKTILRKSSMVIMDPSFDQSEMTKYSKVHPDDVNASMKDLTSVSKMNFIPMIQIPAKLRELLNDDESMIQNANNFPSKLQNANYNKLTPAEYDYTIRPTNQTRVGNSSLTLEDKLTMMRASLGLQVHGSDRYAKTMKYFMYNRFGSSDSNLAHSKSFTKIFFTRPDLNILTGGGNPTITAQCQNHSESSMLWLLYPDLFKLLVDKSRSMDSNNFNMLLSNNIQSFTMSDERINTILAGKSWSGYEMPYGNAYTGRSGGEFSVSFLDTKYYSITNLLKLWLTYIDNVSRGAWWPSYDLYNLGKTNPKLIELSDSHVYTKTLDYAASCYVFKLDETGSNILYWTKYYGVFPINTGASALSWNISDVPGKNIDLNITFQYAYKRDMSPIALMEFNNCAGINKLLDNENLQYNSSYNLRIAQSDRPYVFTPFIRMTIPRGNPSLYPDMVDPTSDNLATVRLEYSDYPINNNRFPKDKELYSSFNN